MGINWAASARTSVSAAAAAAVLAVGLAACSGIDGPVAAPTTTVTATAPASQASAANSAATPPASHAADAAGTSADTTGTLPDYQPSNMVSKTSTSTVLTSPDSVTKIGAFYADVLAKDGWHVISSSIGFFHASFTASRDHQGASISVYPRWGGSGISISTYPR